MSIQITHPVLKQSRSRVSMPLPQDSLQVDQESHDPHSYPLKEKKKNGITVLNHNSDYWLT